jgi:LPS O-antigen subunit length determinant protein (WzzB/FepE family)
VIQSDRIHDPPVPQDARHEIDLRALWSAVCRHKLIVAATAATFVALALYLALTATFIFRGEVTVAQVHETGAGGLSSLAGQFGGLASLAGLNFNESTQGQARQAVLQSRQLVEEFIKRNGVLPLMARGAKKPPTLWIAVEIFRKANLALTEDKVKGLTTVSIDWTDPGTAARWANAFVGLANDLIRTRAIDDASRNIDYLNKQLVKTNNLELQSVMYNLIEQETKTLMLANGRVEYAFTIVDPAVPPEKRISPKRTLLVASGLLVGLVFGALVAIVFDSFQRRRT